MAINHAFEEYIQNDGEHTNNNPVVASPRDNKVRPYFVIYLSWLSKSDPKFRFQICD